MRIVSLLPSATEIICALGLGPQLVGVTHECDYPPEVTRLPRVTRTLLPKDAASLTIDTLVREQLAGRRSLYSLDLQVLEACQPDLLVTQSLCQVCAVAEAEVDRAAHALPTRPAVLELEPTNLEEVLASLVTVATAAGVPQRAQSAIEGLRYRLHEVEQRVQSQPQPRVALLEWLDPPFSCGHWSPELVARAGGTEVLGQAGKPSRTLRWDEVAAAAPEVLFVAACGFSTERTLADIPMATASPQWRDLPAVRNGKVYVTDGNAYFSRPGPRLVDSVEILAHTLHPDACPLPAHLPPAVQVARS